MSRARFNYLHDMAVLIRQRLNLMINVGLRVVPTPSIIDHPSL
jgi:hypothetical protein